MTLALTTAKTLTKDKRQGLDRRSVASKLSYLGFSDVPTGCCRATGLVPVPTRGICPLCRRAAGNIDQALTGLDGGGGGCNQSLRAGANLRPPRSR